MTCKNVTMDDIINVAIEGFIFHKSFYHLRTIVNYKKDDRWLSKLKKRIGEMKSQRHVSMKRYNSTIKDDFLEQT